MSPRADTATTTQHTPPRLDRAPWVACVCVALCGVGLPSAASADTQGASAVTPATTPAAPTPTTARALLQDLLEQQESRAGDPDYDYLLGVTALEAGEPLLALDALERVVLHRPEHAGAWLDLAIVHARLGDIDSAQAILAHVEASFAPPPALRQQIAAARRALDEQRLAQAQAAQRSTLQRLTSQWHGDIALLGGYSSNANAGIGVGGFTLTLPGGGTTPVDVAPEQRPRGDAMLQLRGTVYRDLFHDDGSTTSVLGYLRGRRFASEGDFHYHEAAAGVAHSRPLGWGWLGRQWAATGGLSLRHLALGDQALGTFYTATLGLRSAAGACSVAGTLDLEYRNYSREGYFSSRLPWLGAGLDCRQGAHTLQLAARVGYDSPHGARAGGDTTRLEASALWRWQAGSAWTLDALLYYVRNSDHSGYSPLLNNGDERTVQRLGQRLALQYALDPAGRWRAVLELEHSRDTSNLAIFRLDERQALLGLRYVF